MSLHERIDTASTHKRIESCHRDSSLKSQCIHAPMCIHTFIHLHTNAHTFTCIHMPLTCTCHEHGCAGHMCVCLHMYTLVPLHTCTHAFTCTHHTQGCTCTYMNTHMPWQSEPGPVLPGQGHLPPAGGGHTASKQLGLPKAGVSRQLQKTSSARAFQTPCIGVPAPSGEPGSALLD